MPPFCSSFKDEIYVDFHISLIAIVSLYCQLINDHIIKEALPMQVQRYSDTPMYESFLKDCVSTIAISNAHDVSTSAPTFIQISRQAGWLSESSEYV